MASFEASNAAHRELVDKLYVPDLPDFVNLEWVKQVASSKERGLVTLKENIEEQFFPAPFFIWSNETSLHELVFDILHTPYATRVMRGVGKGSPGLYHHYIFAIWLTGVIDKLHDEHAKRGEDLREALKLYVPGEIYRRLRDVGMIDELRSLIVIYSFMLVIDPAELEEFGDTLVDLLPFVRRMNEAHNALSAFEETPGSFLPYRGNQANCVSPYRSADDGKNPDWTIEQLQVMARPAVTLPSFVTTAWLKDKVGLSGSIKGQMTKLEPSLAACDDAPFRNSGEDLTTAILRGLSNPLVGATLAQGIVRDDNASARDNSIFRPFYRTVYAGLKLAADGDDPSFFWDDEVADFLNGAGKLEELRDYIFLRGSELVRERYVEMLEDEDRLGDFPDRAELLTYLRQRRLLRLWLFANGKGGLVSQAIWKARDELIQHPGSSDGPALTIFDIPSIAAPTAEPIKEPEMTTVRTQETSVDKNAIVSVSAERLAYQDILTAIINTASNALLLEPSWDVTFDLENHVDRLSIAYSAYEESILPKRVPAEDLLVRTNAARNSIMTLSSQVGLEHDVPEAGVVADLSEGGAAAIEGKLTVTETAVGKANDAHSRVVELDRSAASASLIARKAIHQQIDAETEILVGDVEVAVGAYREVVELFGVEGASPEAAEHVSSDVDDEVTEQPASEPITSIDQVVAALAERPETPITVEAQELDVVEEEVGDDEVVEIAVADAEVLATAGVMPELREPEVAVAVNPEIGKVDRKLWALIGAGHLGLAHGLAESANATLSGALSLSSHELAFAAMAGNMNHASMLASPTLLSEALANVLQFSPAISSGNADANVARRIMLYPAAVEMTLFHPNSSASEVLRIVNGLGEQIQDKARPLSLSVTKISRQHLHLSPALLQEVTGQMAAKDGVAAVKQELIDRISHLSRATYNFEVASKIRNAMLERSGPVGELKSALMGSDDAALNGAKAFGEKMGTQPLIGDAVRRTTSQIGIRTQLDGVARNQLMIHLHEIAKAAAAYVDRRHAARAISEGERSKLTGAVAELRQNVKLARDGFKTLSAGEGEVASAARFAEIALGKFDQTLSGSAPAVPEYAHQLALYGDMVLLPTLQFGRSWQPVTLDASEVMQAVMDAEMPLLPFDQQARDARYEQLYRSRVAASSLAGAHLMVELSRHFGVSSATADRMSSSFKVDLETAREDLSQFVGKTRELVDRVLRFGSLGNPEEAGSHMSVIDAVDRATIPDLVTLDDRSLQADVSSVSDISLAKQKVEHVAQVVQAFLDEPRDKLLGRIDKLEGKLSKADMEHLRKLCFTNDLLTAGEFVSFAESNGEIPKSRSRTHRHDRFVVALPKLAAMGNAVNDTAATALKEGTSFAGLAFDEQSPARREEAFEILQTWRDLFRRWDRVREPWYPAAVATLLEKLGGTTTMPTIYDKGTSVQTKRFIGDVNYTVPTDSESLILPDFGSLTKRLFRLCFMNTLPSEATLKELHASAGSQGVILFVGEVVSPERRLQFLQANIQALRKIILVDTASVLFALSEPEQRAATLIEMGQPYSWAAPYGDWGRDKVPEEMFVGRRAEISKLYDMHGSCVVYGGRRLGKTALLKHLQLTKHDPANGVLIGFADVQNIGNGQLLTKAVWNDIAAALPDVFSNRAGLDAKRVTDGISKWLNQDQRRRIIMLIDEADDFVKADAAQGYPEFLALQRLMSDTGRRFKLVLSGLHNVTRLVQTGNDPIKQISSNPQRVGPIMNDELGDAEDLVVRPFAALGMEFESRADVWSLLSRANYLPVLVQTYAKHLLGAAFEESKRTGEQVRILTSGMVEAVFDGRHAVDDVKDKFLLTLRIDQRYELLAYVVANLVLAMEADGMLDKDSVTISQIRDSAIDFWPQGFGDRGRVSLFEDLVDEMEGLGILRRVPGGRWTLRSPAVVRLLGSRTEVESVLMDFENRKAPSEFDPKSSRRFFEAEKPWNFEGRVPSPLTLSQEREIVTGAHPVNLVFGTAAADIDLVALSIKTATGSFSDVNNFDVQFGSFRDKAQLLDRIGSLKPAHRGILIVHTTSDWMPDWVTAVVRHRLVVDRSVKIVFVGGPKHAERMSIEPGAMRLPNVRVFNLEPWSGAFLDSQIIEKAPALDATRREKLVSVTGGWNAPMTALFHGLGGQKKLENRIDRHAAEPYGEDAKQRFGLDGSFGAICKQVTELTGVHGFTMSDITAAMSMMAETKPWTGESVLSFGIKVGVFQQTQGNKGEDAVRSTKYELSQVAQRLLGMGVGAN